MVVTLKKITKVARQLKGGGKALLAVPLKKTFFVEMNIEIKMTYMLQHRYY